ncbi:MAG: hypothetical protein II269_03630 [Bacteroidaceae bacterium]|nr:hypothetical protein [Bacteroidaceae bacterium]
MSQSYHRLLIAIAFIFSHISTTYAEPVWALVTDVSELEVGDQVIITARNYNYAIGTEAYDEKSRQAIPIEKNDNFCITNESVEVFTINKSGDYFIFQTSDNQYLATTGVANEDLVLESSSTKKGANWTITIEATGKATIKSQLVRIRFYYTGDIHFRCNPNEGINYHDDVVIYKLTDSESINDCIVTFSVDNTEEIKTIKKGSSFNLPTEVPEVTGLDFVGWSTTPFPIGTTKTPELNNPGETVTIDDTTTYYAVYAKKGEVREPAYVKIVNQPNNWSGTYLIVCESESIVLNASLRSELISKQHNYDNIKISNNQIISDNLIDSMSVKIEKTTGGYTIQLLHYDNKNTYYIYNDGTNNFITAYSTSKANTISFEGNNEIHIISNDDKVEKKIIQYNQNTISDRFGYYSDNSNYLPIQLYKLNQTSSAYTYYTTSLNIEVTANKYGYSTWYSTVPVNIPEGLNAYYCTIEGNATATLHPIHGIIPSSTAAILYSPETATTQSPKTYTLSYTNATTQNVSGNHLIGYTEDTEVNNGVSHYALNALNGIVGFYVPKTALGDNPTPESAFIAKAGKAYLSINPNEAPISYAIKRVDETDINPTIETMPRCEMQIYDLFGRPIKHAGKGIYITNGKKVFF